MNHPHASKKSDLQKHSFIDGNDAIMVNYPPVDLRETPDFSDAKITGVFLTHEDEVLMRHKIGQVIDAGNNLLGYSRKELEKICDIKSAQFSKIIHGEAWLNIGNLGLWGFATGITPTDVAQLTPLKAEPKHCIAWYINGRLHHLDHDEFDWVIRLICRRFHTAYSPVEIIGIEPTPRLSDKTWKSQYLDDLSNIVATRLIQLREHLSLSQQSFAEIIGVTTDTIKRYESGKYRFNRGIYSTLRLHATLNINPIDLTIGSLHHKLRYVQEQRHQCLLNIVKKISYNHYSQLRRIAFSLSKSY